MKQPDDTTVVQVAGQTVTSHVVSTIQAASKNTGVSFSYLMAQANKESAFAPEAGSKASSAAGLFQFTKGTWLQLIKTHGANHGLGDVAEQIRRTAKGEYTVSDPTLRQQILDLRRDPQLASLMAGEYAKDNKAWLEKTLGRPVNSTDLYLAHFLGPGGAAKVLKAKAENPDQVAAELLPGAAHKNHSVFYDHNHSPRSVTAVYDRIHHSIERPMKQYAQLEEKPTVTAPLDAAATKGGTGAHHHHHHHGAHGATKTADAAWPFETDQWPPRYVPATAPADKGTVSAADPQKVAYTDVSQSADQISAPMPAAAPTGTATPGDIDAKSPIGQLLKGLFG